MALDLSLPENDSYPMQVSPDLQSQRDQASVDILKNEQVQYADDPAAVKANDQVITQREKNILPPKKLDLSVPVPKLDLSIPSQDDGYFDRLGTGGSKIIQSVKDLGREFAHDYSEAAKKVKENINPDDFDLGTGIAYGAGAIKGAATPILQGLGLGARGVAQVLNPQLAERYMGRGAEGIAAQNEAIAGLMNKIPGMETPAAKAGAEAVALPFAGFTTLIKQLPTPELQEAANSLLLMLPGFLGRKGTVKDTAHGDALNSYLNPDVKPPEMPQNGPVGAPEAPVGTPVPKTQGDLFGTEDLTSGGPINEPKVANPFLDSSKLTLDENEMPRDAGLSADVQREAYDLPKTDDLLQTANEALAERRETASPHDMDQIALQQEALFQMQERNAIQKESQVDRAWNDYGASNTVARIPALKETLENPIGSGLPRQTEFFPEDIPTEYRAKSGEVNMTPEDIALAKAREMKKSQTPVQKAKEFFTQDLDELAANHRNRPQRPTSMNRKRQQEGNFDPFMFVDLAKGLKEAAEATGKQLPKGLIGARDKVERDAREMVSEGIGERPSPTDINGKPRDPQLLDHLNKVYDRASEIIKSEKTSDPNFRFQGAAFRDKETGQVHNTGPIHNRTSLPVEAQAKSPESFDTGFQGSDGKFYTRQEATAKLREEEILKNSNPLDTTGPYKDAPHYDGRTPQAREAASAIRNSNPNFGKNKVSPLGGLGKRQGGAIYFGRELPEKPLEQAAKDFPDLIEDFKNRGITFSVGPEEHQILTHYNGKVVNDHVTMEAALEAAEYDSSHYKVGDQVTALFSKKQRGGLNLEAFLPESLVNFLKGKKGPAKEKAVNDILDLAKRDNRSGAEYVTEMKDNPNFISDKDIPAQVGMHSGSWRAILDAISEPKNLAARTLAFFDNKMAQHLEEVHRMNIGTKHFFDEAYKHYGDKVLKRFKLDDFKKDIGIAIRMEGGKDWFDGTNYIPTVQQLIENGMSPASAKVWHGIHTAMDIAWDTMAKTHTIMGRKIPPRVPGYLPHQFKGSYSVQLYTLKEDGTKDYYGSFHEYNRKSAQAIYNKIGKFAKANGLEITLETPKAEGNGLADTFNGMWAAKDILDKKSGGLNQGMAKVLESLYQSAAEGIVSAALDRSHPTKIGYELERIGRTGEEGLSRGDVKKAFHGIENTSKAINEWYGRVKFTDRVLFPLDKSGMLDQPNLRRAVQNYTNQYLNIPNKVLEVVDIKVRDIFIRRGLNPELLNNVASMTNSGFAKIYLWAKPAFYAANRLQSALTPGVLFLLQANNGGKGSIALALARSVPDILKAQVGKGFLVDEARKAGHRAPSFMENLGPAKMNDPLSSYIEQTTRSEAYIMGYHYHKQFMNHEDALAAAGTTSDMVSVPYDRARGTPNLLSRMPVALRPLTLFATYNQHMLGLYSATIRSAKAGAENKIPSQLYSSASSMIGLLGTSIGLFGLGGLPYMQNYDQIIDSLDKQFGFDFPSSKEWARWIGEATDSKTLGAMGEFGIPSMATGVDISSSGQGASIQIPTAFSGMLSTLASLAILAMAAPFKKYPVTAEQMWDKVSKLPDSISGAAEHILKGEGFRDILKQISGEEKSYTPGREGLHAKDFERTGTEVVANWIGINSTRQSDMRVTERLFQRKQASEQTNVTKLMDFITSTSNDNLKQKAVEELYQMHIESENAVSAAMIKYQMEKQLTTDERRALAASSGSTTAGRWYKDWLELKGMEPIAGGVR